MMEIPIIPIKIIDDGFESEPQSLTRLLYDEIKQTKNGDYIDLHQWFKIYGKKDIINTIKLMRQAVGNVDIHLRKNTLVVKWNGVK